MDRYRIVEIKGVAYLVFHVKGSPAESWSRIPIENKEALNPP